jgi:hypothetical protein
MKGTVTSLLDARFAVFVAILSCVVAGLLASGRALAEVRDTISTPDAVQYGEGDGEGMDDGASDAAITASQVFQEPAPTEDTSSSSGSVSTDATDETGETIQATPTSKRSPVTEGEEEARAVKMTELPDTGGPTAPLLGVALVAGGLLVGAAGRAVR